ncbi:MAG: leucine-rich repeat domain-containing protein [Bacteroidaceae bacterium]|nr:leucine-rich repeat domain-containing protein [Bacteroidaceae bacterium]
MKRYIISSVMATLMGAMTATAHDFSATFGGQRIYFNITDTLQKTVEITYKGSITAHAAPEVKGSLAIPVTVHHLNQVFTVASIGAKAFAGASGLTDVVIPSSIRQIGDFAFERCTALRSIVFPGSKPAMGQGIFFLCKSLQNISLGSDWTEINFSMFRWSDSLQTVTVPSRLTRIQGLKTLRSLTTIQVDANNPSYSAIDGVLYNKQQTRLLCVPRAAKGALVVPEGVTEVMWGSLIDCPAITAVDFPASLTVLSFRELSRMPLLKSITLRGERVLATASLNGCDTTLFVVSSPDVQLLVPKKMQKAYSKALGLSEAEFTEIAAHKPQGYAEATASVPYFIRKEQMIKEKNIRQISTK